MPGTPPLVLVTGFEPFADAATNPSWDAAVLLARDWDEEVEGARLVIARLPVVFATVRERLAALVAEHAPDVVVATGLAGGSSAVRIERVALNLADARIPDNAGAQPLDEPSVTGAPTAYFATLPVKAIAAAVADAGVPASVSHSAGTFVCNHVMFAALDEASSRDGLRAGFVHVPWAAETAPAGVPALPLGDIVRAVEIAVRTTLDVRADPPLTGGTLS